MLSTATASIKNFPLITSFSQTLAVFRLRGYVDNSDFPDANGLWLEGENDESSTFRELKAIYDMVECYAPQIAHSKVKIYADNQGACSIMEKGSARIKLNYLAIDIFTLSLKNDITLSPPVDT